MYYHESRTFYQGYEQYYQITEYRTNTIQDPTNSRDLILFQLYAAKNNVCGNISLVSCSRTSYGVSAHITQ